MLSSQLLSNGRFNDGLPAFITRGLDTEQIWQQIELRNDHKNCLSACTQDVVRIQSKRLKHKKLHNKIKKPTTADEEKAADSDDLSVSDEEEENALQAIKKRLAEQPSNQSQFDNFSGGDSSDGDELDFDFEMDKELSKRLSDEEDVHSSSKVKKKSSKSAVKHKSVVDDKFFKLAEMENFLDSEDKKEEKRRKREKTQETEYDSEDDDVEVDEEIDMFNDAESENDDVMEAMYGDFFDPPDESPQNKTDAESASNSAAVAVDSGENESSKEDDEEMNIEQDAAADSESDMEGYNNGSGKDSDNSNESIEDEKTAATYSKKAVSFEKDLFNSAQNEVEKNAAQENKSSFEKKQDQLRFQAQEMEEQSLKEAPWELTGEATASKRPENSLLETVLDFQHTTRAAPVITDETTKSLEDYIKQRIKDKAFDDVERKEKPKEDPFEFKKRIVLDQEKSKLSLGELYEQEFLKQQQQDKEEVKADPECEKIEKDLHKLFQQLDALCNFRYTPMKAGTEVKIIVNTPAITMEEVAPTASTDAQLLAPEEVKGKLRHEFKADEERDATDKKRDRRLKKKEKRERKKAKEAREKVVEKMNPGLGNKYSKAKAIKHLEQISKFDKNVSIIKDESKKLASSSAFFNQLQEEVQTNVRAKKAMKAKKKKPVVNASKLML